MTWFKMVVDKRIQESNLQEEGKIVMGAVIDIYIDTFAISYICSVLAYKKNHHMVE